MNGRLPVTGEIAFVSFHPVGIKRKALPQSSASSHPAGAPKPPTSPRSLMVAAFVSLREKPAGMFAFRSIIDPFSHKKALASNVSHANDSPATCPWELI